MYLVTAKEMRDMDNETIESFGLPGMVLMENAGLGTVRFLVSMFPDILKKKVAIFSGRGNNGGDGFVIARYLNSMKVETCVYLLSKKDIVKGDAALNLKLLSKTEVPIIEITDEKSFQLYEKKIAESDILIDAILGTGLNSDVKGLFKEVINYINTLKKPVLAVDIPSGLNCDSGDICGVAVKADCTATFAFAKLAHMLYPGIDYTGKLDIINIGIPSYIVEKSLPQHRLLTSSYIASFFTKRAFDVHKGSTGHLLVIAGSRGKSGAAAMTAQAAIKSGSGLVSVAVPSSINSIMECLLIEAMTLPLNDTSEGMFLCPSTETLKNLFIGKKCIAIGPGIGRQAETIAFVHKVIKESCVPIVIDADGLNCIGKDNQIFAKSKVPIVLTPHPGEMSTLTGLSIDTIQKNRIFNARQFAEKFGVYLVLKGAKTIIAHPDGKIFINPTGNTGMASGGMGDVLTGIIASLITQGMPVEKAVQAGVFIHGMTADMFYDKTAFGFTASDVIQGLPQIINKIIMCKKNNQAIDCHIINFIRRSEEAVLEYCDERTTQ